MNEARQQIEEALAVAPGTNWYCSMLHRCVLCGRKMNKMYENYENDKMRAKQWAERTLENSRTRCPRSVYSLKHEWEHDDSPAYLREADFADALRANDFRVDTKGAFVKFKSKPAWRPRYRHRS